MSFIISSTIKIEYVIATRNECGEYEEKRAEYDVLPWHLELTGNQLVNEYEPRFPFEGVKEPNMEEKEKILREMRQKKKDGPRRAPKRNCTPLKCHASPMKRAVKIVGKAEKSKEEPKKEEKPMFPWTQPVEEIQKHSKVPETVNNGQNNRKEPKFPWSQPVEEIKVTSKVSEAVNGGHNNFIDGAGKIKSLTGGKKASKAKRISKGALADLFLYTYSQNGSRYQKIRVGNPREYLEKVLNEEANEKEIQLFEKVLNGKSGTEEMNQLKKIAEDETIGKKPKEMEGWNIKQINPEIEGIQKIIEMSERIEGGCVYLDTEDSYNTLQRMDKLALIQIADPLQKQVLLIRTHQLNDLEMENVRFGIEQLINKRGIKSFGDLSILGLPLNDIQPFRNKKEKMSLKDATEKNGIYMDKGEQMSNWTNRKLRKSQLFYAAFDAIVLSLL